MQEKARVQVPEQEIAARPPTDTAISAVRDGFGWSPGLPSTGEAGRLPRSMASGIRLKFNNNGTWTANGVPCDGRELVVYDKSYSIIRWSVDNMPAEVIPVARGTTSVDLAERNAKVPKAEWRTGLDGKPEAPYQLQRILEFVDANNMERLSWPANVTVIGASRAADDLESRISAARRLRGNDIYPTVKLTHCFMPTQYKGRERPHLKVVGWVRLSEHGGIEPVAMQIDTATAVDAITKDAK